MSTVNVVKDYFYRGFTPKTEERARQLIALAYQTARDQKLYPRAILIRSEIHKTTSMSGMHQVDPLGYHITLCFKDEQQLLRGTHVSSHGYVRDQDNLEFIQATHTEEKSDNTKRQRGKRMCGHQKICLFRHQTLATATCHQTRA
ncbi:hypothetical protein BO94DRAFT_44079 [Aspergillus sclerotioniger CBS 115572]|uniref:Uncharacterized protein n=1 Tax=Aspergillus sclerotioniger CBS 115572 TaxID=1450535 RepID=A0A317WTQ7_9EURO|nr:hypothetical protein BO94DRAFT_44079 [Aspergillus sclerotioniger CBS 115572]PWY89709.1 hypothetical protein BO94DRAFT_44079 [Aspergillus sclerotioniger CBS 115572]